MPNAQYVIDSPRAARLPKPPKHPAQRRALARRLLAEARATLLAVAVRYYGGDERAAKADIYGREL